MQLDQAIKAFAESEKIKSALIWATQLAEIYGTLAEHEKPGAEKMLKALVAMIDHEIQLARSPAPHELWAEARQDVDTAMVMVCSGVAHESGYHLTRALTKVTSIGRQAMGLLLEKGLL
jgi:hypothetical protein